MLPNVTVEGFDPDFDNRRDDDDWMPVCLGYAATVHKFIGSEDDEVLFIDEYDRADQRREFVYTAITRAAKRIVVVRG